MLRCIPRELTLDLLREFDLQQYASFRALFAVSRDSECTMELAMLPASRGGAGLRSAVAVSLAAQLAALNQASAEFNVIDTSNRNHYINQLECFIAPTSVPDVDSNVDLTVCASRRASSPSLTPSGRPE